MIELTHVLQQIAKELTLAQQSQDATIVHQKLAAIKALCELTEKTVTNISQQPTVEVMPSQVLHAMMAQPQQEPTMTQDNLLDF